MKKIIIIISLIVLLLAGFYFFDYIRVTKYDKNPIIAIKVKDDENQLTIYKAIFYKVWVCDYKNKDNKEVFVVGSYNDYPPECTKSINFTNESYTNPNGIKISASDYQTIANFYDVDTINTWTKDSDLVDALYVSNELGKRFFNLKENGAFTYLNEIVNIAIFYDLSDNDGVKLWQPMTNDQNYYYCVKQDSNNKYLFSKYQNGTCDGIWNYKTFTEKWCNLALKEKDNSTVRQFADANCNK